MDSFMKSRIPQDDTAIFGPNLKVVGRMFCEIYEKSFCGKLGKLNNTFDFHSILCDCKHFH